MGVGSILRTDGAVTEKNYTTVEVAAICRVTEWTVREWCKAGTIPATKAGRKWLIPESSLKQYLEKKHG